jgi:hypothetical protein
MAWGRRRSRFSKVLADLSQRWPVAIGKFLARESIAESFPKLLHATFNTHNQSSRVPDDHSPWVEYLTLESPKIGATAVQFLIKRQDVRMIGACTLEKRLREFNQDIGIHLSS